jgi:2-dehydro-3-deoxyphosphooctonate aldolase (KDO 8-P synthase)
MNRVTAQINDAITVGEGHPLTILAGPCVIEDLDTCLEICEALSKICGEVGVNYVFKASFDKANRTSIDSFRGPGLEKGLEILAAVKDRFGGPDRTLRKRQKSPVSRRRRHGCSRRESPIHRQ